MYMHMPCVLIINLYYTSKINIIHSFIHLGFYTGVIIEEELIEIINLMKYNVYIIKITIL